MERRRNSDVIVESLELDGKRVIDIGCGDGHLARHMAKFGARVLGVECNPRQLAKARAAEPVSAVTIVEGMGQALPAASASFQVAVFFNSLHHIPQPFMAKALDEAARVLVPGGMVYVSEPLAEGPFFETCRAVDDESEARARAYQAMQSCPGLTLVREFRYVHSVRMVTFETFRERLVSANAEREARFDAVAEDARARFNALGQRGDDGWYFDQPMRVNLLQRA